MNHHSLPKTLLQDISGLSYTFGNMALLCQKHTQGWLMWGVVTAQQGC